MNGSDKIFEFELRINKKVLKLFFEILRDGVTFKALILITFLKN